MDDCWQAFYVQERLPRPAWSSSWHYQRELSRRLDEVPEVVAVVDFMEEHERRRAAWKAECLEDGGEWVEGRDGPTCVYVAEGSWMRAIERMTARYQRKDWAYQKRDNEPQRAVADFTDYPLPTCTICGAAGYFQAFPDGMMVVRWRCGHVPAEDEDESCSICGAVGCNALQHSDVLDGHGLGEYEDGDE